MTKRQKSEPELISEPELARRLGVSDAAVRKAVKSGRVHPATVDPKGRRWYSEAAARVQWERNTMPEKSNRRKAAPLSPQTSKVNQPIIPDISPPAGLTAVDARTARDAAHARILNFKAEVMEQRLVDVDEVAKLWERQVEQAKRLFLALPTELRMLVPAMTNDDMTLIENRIVAILDNLAAWDPREGSS